MIKRWMNNIYGDAPQRHDNGKTYLRCCGIRATHLPSAVGVDGIRGCRAGKEKGL